MDVRFQIDLETDERGLVTKLLFPSEELEQSEDLVEEFLSHYGVPGMKWGRRRDRDRPGGADGKSNSGPSRKESRALAKNIRRENTAAVDKSIDTARKRIAKSNERFAQAKKDYKGNKQLLGKAAAKQILNGERAKRNITQIQNGEMAQLAKSGKETTRTLLIAGGLIAISAVSAGLQVAANT